jgi:exonuclease VII large subunit
LKDEIAAKFCFNPSDAAEILVSYFNDLKKVFIQTEQDFVEFVKKHIYKVDLDISQESQLYKNSMKQLEEENAQSKKTLEELLKKNMDLEAKKKKYLEEKANKINR